MKPRIKRKPTKTNKIKKITEKEYKTIASEIKTLRGICESSEDKARMARQALTVVAHRVTEIFEKHNSHFDGDKFLQDCDLL